MDYTEGALDIPAQAFRDLLTRNLGPMIPVNSQFQPEHLRDLIRDRRYYALTYDMTVKVIEEYAEALPWIADVCDCDTKTTQFGADMARAARECEWKFGLACAGLNYLSSSMGLPHTERFSGYHSAPIIAFVAKTGDLGLVIVQPPHLRDAETIQEAKYQWPSTEVRGWVIAESLT